MVAMALKAKQNTTVNNNVHCTIQGPDIQVHTSNSDISDINNNNEMTQCASEEMDPSTCKGVAATSSNTKSGYSIGDIDMDSGVQGRSMQHMTTVMDTSHSDRQTTVQEYIGPSHSIVNTNHSVGSELSGTDTDLDFEHEQYEDIMVAEVGSDDDVRDPTYIREQSSSDSDDDEPIPGLQLDHEETVESESTGSKRKITQREGNKKLRMEGKAYKGMKQVDGRWGHCVERGGRILCPRNCSKRCDKRDYRLCSHITEDERREMFDKFWVTMNWEERKVYVNSLVASGATSVKTVENSRRKRSFEYFLWKKNARVQVCKSMFLTTLGIGEHAVYAWCSNALHCIPSKDRKSGEHKCFVI